MGRGKYHSPDIYFERFAEGERVKPIERARMDICGFLGFTERGPIQKPVRITEWKQFQQIFGGFTEKAFLPQSVFGFFNNGAKECLVVRIAHINDADPAKNAAKASIALKDLYNRPTVRVTALNEGSWGNKLKVTVGFPEKPPSTYPTQDLRKGATSARVDVTKGLEQGAVVKIGNEKFQEYRKLTKVTRREVFWSEEEPLDQNHSWRDGAVVEAVEYKLTVTAEDTYEIHDNLNMDPAHPRHFAKVVNGASHLVELEDLRSTTPAPWNMPQQQLEEVLAGGSDGIEWATPADFIGFSRGPENRAGVGLFDEIEEVAQLAAPDIHMARRVSKGFPSDREILAVQQALIDHCERMKTCMAVLDAPEALGVERVREWRDHFDSNRAALYYPWVKIVDPLYRGNEVRTFVCPPSGHTLGIYARNDAEYGVHKAPANEEVRDVVAVERTVLKEEQDVLNPGGINCIRVIPGRGIRVWGARTLTSNPLWNYVSVRRIMTMICRSIYDGTQWTVFEPNDFYLWKTVEGLITTFLSQLWRDGYLKGETTEEAFFVKCDEETNPVEVRDAGQMICDIGVAPIRPAEFIVVRIGQRTKDIITEEPVA